MILLQGCNHPLTLSLCSACGKQIIGARFKCIHASCPDYDLCENCEALPIDVHPSSHAMIKVKHNMSTYEGLQKVFKFAHQSSKASTPVAAVIPAQVASSSVAQPPTENSIVDETETDAIATEKLVDVAEANQSPVVTFENVMTERRVLSPLLPAMVPTAIPVPAPISINRQWWEEFGQNPETPVVYETEGEMELQPVVISSRASSVSAEVVERTEALSLMSPRREPEQDMPVETDVTEDESPFTDSNAVRSSSPSLESVTSATSVPAAPVVLRASFVTDNTIPDGFVIPAGSHFVKSWKIVNDGTADWPKASRLAFMGGDRLGTSSASSEFTVGDVQPGVSIDVNVEFVAPPVVGHYISYWCMQDADGTTFGHRLWCDIEVVDSPEHSAHTSLSSSTVIMPAPGSVVAVSPVAGPASLSPILIPTAIIAGTPTISSVPSEIDIEEIQDDDDVDTESDVSGAWEEAGRAHSPDEFVMVYDSVSEESEDE